jgi:hypothetical protein
VSAVMKASVATWRMRVWDATGGGEAVGDMSA